MNIIQKIESGYYKSPKYPKKSDYQMSDAKITAFKNAVEQNLIVGEQKDKIQQEIWQGTSAYNEARFVYRTEANRIENEFKRDLLEEFGVSDHPKGELLFEKAWERGHSAGYMEVYGVFDDLVELIL